MKSDADAFTHILASLYEAMLDDTQWPATSALIDAACGVTGNALMVGSGPPDDVRAHFVGLYYRGERRADLEREYLSRYHPLDERVPRLRAPGSVRWRRPSQIGPPRGRPETGPRPAPA